MIAWRIYVLYSARMSDPLYAFRMPKEIKEALARLKDRDGMTASEAIRRGLIALLKERGIPVKPAKKGGPKKPTKKR